MNSFLIHIKVGFINSLLALIFLPRVKIKKAVASQPEKQIKKIYIALQIPVVHIFFRQLI